MVAWETMDDEHPVMRDFAELWRAADKIVYSRSLESASSARTRIERDFDADAVRQLKEAAQADIGIGGPELAGQAIAAGLVDECHLILVPVLVGGGKRAFPDGVRADLELLDERRFAGGAVYLRYSEARPASAAGHRARRRAGCRPRAASSPRASDASRCRCAA